MKNKFYILILITLPLFSSCAALAFEELLAVGIEESATSMVARTAVRRSIARGIARRSVARAGVKSIAGAATVTNAAALNSSIASNLVVSGGLLVWYLDSMKIEAKIIDRSTIQIGGKTSALPGEIYQVTAEKLNVRTGPSTDYQAFMQIKHDRVVFVESFNDGWAKVRIGYDIEGYVSQKYISPISEKQINSSFNASNTNAITDLFVYSSCASCQYIDVSIDDVYQGRIERFYLKGGPNKPYSEATINQKLSYGKHIVTATDEKGHKWFDEVNLRGGAYPICLSFSKEVAEEEKRLELEAKQKESENALTEITFFTTCPNCGESYIYIDGTFAGSLTKYYISGSPSKSYEDGTITKKITKNSSHEIKIVTNNGKEIFLNINKNQSSFINIASFNTEKNEPEIKQVIVRSEFTPIQQNSPSNFQIYRPLPQNYQSVPQNYQPASQNYQSVPQNYQPASQNYQYVPQNYQPASQNYQYVPQNYQPASQNYQPIQESTTKVTFGVQFNGQIIIKNDNN